MMLSSLILGIWLILSIDRQKQAFLEASLFTFLSMAIIYLMDWSVPKVDNVWLLSWVLCWVFALASFWLLDVVSINFPSGAIFAVLAGLGYFLVLHDSPEWVKLFLDGKLFS